MVGGVVDVVERAYDVDAPESRWLESIRETAARVLPNVVATQAYTFVMSPSGAFRFGEIASDAESAAWMRRCHEAGSPSLIQRAYLRGLVTSPHQWLTEYRDDPGIQLYLAAGLRVNTANGIDPSGNGCSLAIIRRGAIGLSRGERTALERVAAHLAAAHRLRKSLGPDCSGSRLLDDSDAVLSSDGAMLHAQGDARTSGVRSALQEAARRIDRARTRSATDSPEEGLALWRALVDGRWSIVERFDSDGRRLFVARRNDPASREHRALDELERKLVALVALGHSQKMCAYEVGRSVSAVSALIRSATKKLGVRTRAELVALHGALVAEAAAGLPHG